MEGQVVGDRYEVVERIGSGGMAVVWRARDRNLGRSVALKILHPHLAQDPTFRERFRREARHAAQLSHPSVVAVFDTGVEDDRAYIVMELVEGRTLHDILKERGPLSASETARIARHVLAALAAAHHAGLVHRDVKPANVLVTPSGDVKVTDFGIAKGLGDAAHLTQTGMLMGTASYLSPEQASGHPATPASDLYALGCVLFECLTGAPPFKADTPVATAVLHQSAPIPRVSERRPDISPSFAAVVERALAKDPAYRFASAREMDTAIAASSISDVADDAPTLVVAPSDDAPTAAVRQPDHTQVLGHAPEPRSRAGRLFGIVAVVLLIGAAAWAMALVLTTTQDGDEAPLAEATPSPTQAPALAATPAPTSVPTTPEPTPEPSPSPTPFDFPTPRTPTPPSTPDFDFDFGDDPTQPPQPTPPSG